MDLSDDVWSTGRIVIPSGRIAVIRAVLDTRECKHVALAALLWQLASAPAMLFSPVVFFCLRLLSHLLLHAVPDVTQSVNAIPDAGGKTLNLSQRNDTFYVQTGGTMEFDGVRITNAASAEAYRQHLGAAAGLLPYGLALYPTLNADAGAQVRRRSNLPIQRVGSHLAVLSRFDVLI